MAISNRWPVVLVAALFPLWLGVAPSSAQTFTPVFTKQYVRAAGAPVTVSDSFAVCDPKGTFRLVVVNGPGGQGRISSGSLFVNEAEVVQPQDFNQQVAQIVRPLTNVVENNRLDVRLASGPAAAIQVTVEGIQKCFGITIVSPTPGSVITTSPVLVQGEANAAPGTEVGVTVNGILAQAGSGRFGAFVPLAPGSNTITATLVDAAGNTASDSITVQAVLAEAPKGLALTASPEFGLAPLTATLHASFLGAAANYQWDVDGNGTIDAAGLALDEVTFQYQASGVFFPRVLVTDTRGTQFTETGIVAAFAQTDVIPLLLAKWQALKDALRAGDVPKALTFIAQSRRAQYEAIFRNLAVSLSNIDQVLTDLRFVQARERFVEFEMLRTDDGTQISYLVRFVIDEDGIWRIRDM